MDKAIFNKNNVSVYAQFIWVMRLFDRCRLDPINHFIYRALWLCDMGRYDASLKIVNRAQTKLNSSVVMYTHAMSNTGYKMASGETLPITEVMRRSIGTGVSILHAIKMQELYIETHMMDLLFVPPSVFTIFLQYISNRKLGHTTKAKETLTELSLLMHSCPSHIMDEVGQIISWHMLGICQQMDGDYIGACHSYFVALRHRWNKVRKASCIRLCTLLVNFFI